MRRSARLKNQLLAKVFTAIPGLAARWGRSMEATAGSVPWAAPQIPLRDAEVALITTGGVHLADHEPFDMEDPDGDPSVREIPIDTPRQNLRITHDHYNHRDARRDINLVLPLDRVAEMVQRGVVGQLHEIAYSFMGHIDGAHVAALENTTAPAVAKALQTHGVDYALLVPA